MTDVANDNNMLIMWLPEMVGGPQILYLRKVKKYHSVEILSFSCNICPF